MKITYNQVADTLNIDFTDAPASDSEVVRPGVFLDFDDAGNIVSMEITEASQRVSRPGRIEYQVEPVGREPSTGE